MHRALTESLDISVATPGSTVLPDDSFSVGQQASLEKSLDRFGNSHVAPGTFSLCRLIYPQPQSADIAQWISKQQGEAFLEDQIQHDPYLIYRMNERRGVAMVSARAREDARLNYMLIQERREATPVESASSSHIVSQFRQHHYRRQWTQ